MFICTVGVTSAVNCRASLACLLDVDTNRKIGIGICKGRINFLYNAALDNVLEQYIINTNNTLDNSDIYKGALDIPV